MYPQPQPNNNPDRLSYSPNYDKELYDKVRTELSNTYNILIAEAKTSTYLADPDGLGRISALLNDMKILLLTYREKIPERDELETQLIFSKMYPLQDRDGKPGLLRLFISIRDQFIDIMAHKHAFMDRVERKEKWEDLQKKNYKFQN